MRARGGRTGPADALAGGGRFIAGLGVSGPQIIEGWYGTGLVEQLTPIQMELNRIALRTQQAMHLMAVPRVYVERGSQVVLSHLNNDIGNIIEYTGTPPVVNVGQAASGEVYAQFDRLYAKAYETTGISQLSAASLKPEGLNSGRAIREYNDLQTDRFAVIASRCTGLATRITSR